MPLSMSPLLLPIFWSGPWFLFCVSQALWACSPIISENLIGFPTILPSFPFSLLPSLVFSGSVFPLVSEQLMIFLTLERRLGPGVTNLLFAPQNLYDSIRNEPFKIPEDDGNDLTHTFFNPDREGWLLKLGTSLPEPAGNLAGTLVAWVRTEHPQFLHL